jgi:hypothetical protein
MSFLDRIKLRVFELMIQSDLSRSEATRRAAKEFGASIKDIPVSKPTRPKPSNSTESNAKEELFARIFGIKERQEASPTIGGKIKRYLFAEDHQDQHVSNNAAIPVEPAPKPAPSSTYSEVYTGNSGRGVDLNKEFRDNEATSNWRKSIEASIERSVSKPRVPTDEVNPLNDAEVNAALARQQFRVVK